MNIVIVEDSMATRHLLESILKEELYTTTSFGSGKAALFHLSNSPTDFLLLDIGLPDMSGYEVVEKIKKNPKVYGNPYVILLTGKVENSDVVVGFEKGADDYIKKPFNPDELKLRIKAASRNFMTVHNYYNYGPIEIDSEAQSISYEGINTKITKTEFKLLMYLIRNKGTTLSRKDIYQKIWEGAFFEGNRTIDVYIRRLKIKFPCLERDIESVSGVGYRLNEK